MFAAHGNSALAPHANFYRQQLQSGLKLRVILQNPESGSVEIQDRLTRLAQNKTLINSSLETLEHLIAASPQGSCDVRLWDGGCPFSMYSADMGTTEGRMTVEFTVHDATIDERPHVYLTAESDSYWFNFYKNQFEQAWQPRFMVSPPVIG